MDEKWILSNFSKRKGKAIEKYKLLISEGKGQSSLWGELKNQVYLSGEEFVEEMLSNIEEGKELSEIPSPQRRKVARSISSYKAEIKDRDEAIVAAYKSGAYSMKEIGEYFELHYSRVGRIIKKSKVKRQGLTLASFLIIQQQISKIYIWFQIKDARHKLDPFMLGSMRYMEYSNRRISTYLDY